MPRSSVDSTAYGVKQLFPLHEEEVTLRSAQQREKRQLRFRKADAGCPRKRPNCAGGKQMGLSPRPTQWPAGGGKDSPWYSPIVAEATGTQGSMHPRFFLWENSVSSVVHVSESPLRSCRSAILIGFLPLPRNSVEDSGLHQASSAERCAAEVERERHLDTGRCLLRSE